MRFPGLIRAALAAAALLLALPGAARAEDRILFLSSSSPTLPWPEAMLDAIQEGLAARGRANILHAEFLDRSRLSEGPDEAAWADFLAAKYNGARPAAIIADGAPAIRLAARLASREFASPIVGIFPNFNDLKDVADAVAVKVTTGPHIDQTVRMALAQRPGVREVVIVSDTTGLSQHLARVIRAALAGTPVQSIRHLSNLRLEELDSALADQPADSLVLYTHMFGDAAGRQLRPDEVAARLAAASSVPVYVLFEGDIGTGAVGGYVNDPKTAGRVAARAALDLLDGVAPRAGESSYSSRAVLDWRQLRRWGIGEEAVPPDAEIRFRQPSVIEEHFVEAMVALAFIGVLSAVVALLTVLFVQRGRHARALREANSRLEERVAARTREISRALAGEQAARERLRTFLDMATHEFKTPLAVIDSSAQMLERLVDAEREGVGSRLALIRGSVRRVIDLVETCLAGDRIDEERPLRPAPFAPAALVRRVVERQRGHGAAVAADLSALPAACTADPELLEVALDALLDNARRYGPPGGLIEVTARREAGALVISVGDRGPGVPAAEAELIFEKYYRGTAGRSTSGTGIGLALVRTIAGLHGGQVVCRPRDGGGAMFLLIIPQERDESLPDIRQHSIAKA